MRLNDQIDFAGFVARIKAGISAQWTAFQTKRATKTLNRRIVNPPNPDLLTDIRQFPLNQNPSLDGPSACSGEWGNLVSGMSLPMCATGTWTPPQFQPPPQRVKYTLRVGDSTLSTQVNIGQLNPHEQPNSSVNPQ